MLLMQGAAQGARRVYVNPEVSTHANACQQKPMMLLPLTNICTRYTRIHRTGSNQADPPTRP